MKKYNLQLNNGIGCYATWRLMMTVQPSVESLVTRALAQKQISRDLALQLNALMMEDRLPSEQDWRAFDRLSDAVLEGRIEISR